MNTVSGSLENDAIDILFLTFLSIFSLFLRTTTAFYEYKRPRVYALLSRNQQPLPVYTSASTFDVFFHAVETHAEFLCQFRRIG